MFNVHPYFSLKKTTMKFFVCFLFFAALASCSKKNETPAIVTPVPTPAPISTNTIQFVYTSDLHYGLTRTFQGSSVNSEVVNKAMVAQINLLPLAILPNDGGVNGSYAVGGIDYLVVTGDISTREEPPVQSATACWAQFNSDYIQGLTLKNKNNQNTTLLLTCGNHDASDAIGYSKPMSPLTDASSMANIYNLMLSPVIPKTSSTYNYATDKINYSKDVQGIHFMFVNIWPDSANRVWMANDLANVSTTTPVIIFTHDPPTPDPSHFTNPNGAHDINATDQFENLLEERLKDGKTTSAPTTIEEQNFVSFLKLHPNIKAYFHGHTNYNQFYTYGGLNSDISLPVFRVDSPIKGKISGINATNGFGNETYLSFQLVTIDLSTKNLTARECRWNATGANSQITWGSNVTISLK